MKLWPGSAVRDPERYSQVLSSVVRDWLTPIGWPPADVATLATLVLAQVRGLQLDLAATGDRERVDNAFSASLDVLTSRPKT